MEDRKKIHRFFVNDPLLGSTAIAGGLPDLDIYGGGGPLLTLIEAVISQQLADKAARSIFTRLEDHVSGAPGGALSLARAEKGELRLLGISGNKAETIITVCRMVAEKELDLDRLEEMDDGRVRSELTRIKGIGDWTAQMYLIFGLKRRDVWPSTDLGIRKKLSALLKKKETLDAQKVENYGKRWSPYRSYAAIYIWRS